MLVNSLFLDYLKENGLHIHNEESTRDIIGLEFNYGTRSYAKEMEHLRKIAVKASDEYNEAVAKKDKNLIEKAENKRNKISELTEMAHKNKDVYEEISKDDCRILIYENGIDITYTDSKNNAETIHYKMLFRSTGKAKKGSVSLIREELYDKVKNFLYMGIELPAENAPIVEASAYIPLISSGIVGRIQIDPSRILVLKDVDRFFRRDVVSIETDDEGHCIANWIDDYELMNELFDGQALIDTSIFPEWASGYVLLRHHMTKMAAFHANMQMFFKDWCEEHGEDYETCKVKDMFGIDHYLKDILLVTTDNACKWLKFSDILGGSARSAYQYWCEWVRKNDCNFGVVKFSHPSKLGKYQKMSYQHTNSLDENTMTSVCQTTVDYIHKLKNDNEAFKDYLRKNLNFSNDYEVILDLCEWNSDFEKCSYFRERKQQIISAYLKKAKSGEIIQNGDNLTIVGSPYAMLLYAASGNPDDCDLDDTLLIEDGTIQCFTSRFENNEYLVGFRNPFNGRFNMDYLHNHYDEKMLKYFNFSDQIIAVNMIGTDFQDRNNGSDQDSDSLYVTNQPDMVNHAKMCYLNYPTIVNNIGKDKNKYKNTPRDFAIMDNGLAKSQRDIGESSNLAQLSQTYASTFNDKKYDNYTAILSIIAQCSIDSAKRKFNVDLSGEILRIKKSMDINKNGYPKFWKAIKSDFNKNKINKCLHCPMDYLQDIIVDKAPFKKDLIEFKDLLVASEEKPSYKKSKKVEKLIMDYSLYKYNSSTLENIEAGDYEWDTWLVLRSDFDKLVEEIRSVTVSANYKELIINLIKRTFMLEPQYVSVKKQMNGRIMKNKSLLLKALYDSNPKVFLSCFKKKTG